MSKLSIAQFKYDHAEPPEEVEFICEDCDEPLDDVSNMKVCKDCQITALTTTIKYALEVNRANLGIREVNLILRQGLK